MLSDVPLLSERSRSSSLIISSTGETFCSSRVVSLAGVDEACLMAGAPLRLIGASLLLSNPSLLADIPSEDDPFVEILVGAVETFPGTVLSIDVAWSLFSDIFSSVSDVCSVLIALSVDVDVACSVIGAPFWSVDGSSVFAGGSSSWLVDGFSVSVTSSVLKGVSRAVLSLSGIILAVFVPKAFLMVFVLFIVLVVFAFGVLFCDLPTSFLLLLALAAALPAMAPATPPAAPPAAAPLWPKPDWAPAEELALTRRSFFLTLVTVIFAASANASSEKD